MILTETSENLSLFFILLNLFVHLFVWIRGAEKFFEGVKTLKRYLFESHYILAYLLNAEKVWERKCNLSQIL